ncbi:Coenzyme F420 hydrogenase/dehydrogenase, beta subunit C-terminal domain [Longibaculum muris]|uniref:Coenzyme F420 hydrogenase/dehydrogenase, beta subunit C-terminal domain n=1 Tax=Longibaculum muris TaxID=1796628 RepID=UPI0012B9FF6D|nr:Coenzyme F420 hydrogenase/dehydrogenase, beta subunit C-terminal domain [Longibaculum muris]
MPIKVTEKCVGCFACTNICPTKCINMALNDEGFIVPEVDFTKCVNCDKCTETCLQQKLPSMNVPIKSYRLLHKNKEIWNKSTSGGAFSAICSSFNDDTYFCGASFDENLEVKHIIVKGYGNDFNKLLKSKYVQSNIGSVFTEIKKLLLSDNTVIFSGTPCQVAALKLYLGCIKYDNLYCIDVACHGVGSPKILKQHLMTIENKNKTKINKIGFREKRFTLSGLEDYGFLIESDNKKVIDYSDIYTKAFHNGIVIRSSCLDCQFHKKERVGDITIADLKGMYETFPKEIKDKFNRSAVFANTKKGVEIVERLKQEKDIECIECTFGQASKNNSPLYEKHNQKISDRRNQFFDMYKTLRDDDVDTLLNNYINKESIILKIWLKIPEKQRVIVKKILRKGDSK